MKCAATSHVPRRIGPVGSFLTSIAGQRSLQILHRAPSGYLSPVPVAVCSCRAGTGSLNALKLRMFRNFKLCLIHQATSVAVRGPACVVCKSFVRERAAPSVLGPETSETHVHNAQSTLGTQSILQAWHLRTDRSAQKKPRLTRCVVVHA